jgi:hypothetical protein
MPRVRCPDLFRSAAALAACAGFLSQEWIQRLRDTTDKFVQLSRGYTRDTVLPLGRCTEADPLAGEASDAHHIVVTRHVCKPSTSVVDVHLSSAECVSRLLTATTREGGRCAFKFSHSFASAVCLPPSRARQVCVLQKFECAVRTFAHPPFVNV